jgi:hypothetical protein
MAVSLFNSWGSLVVSFLGNAILFEKINRSIKLKVQEYIAHVSIKLQITILAFILVGDTIMMDSSK